MGGRGERDGGGGVRRLVVMGALLVCPGRTMPHIQRHVMMTRSLSLSHGLLTVSVSLSVSLSLCLSLCLSLYLSLYLSLNLSTHTHTHTHHTHIHPSSPAKGKAVAHAERPPRHHQFEDADPYGQYRTRQPDRPQRLGAPRV